MNYLIDSHCHLDGLVLDKHTGSLDDVLARARAKQVGHFLTIGVSQSNADKVKTIAEQYADVHCSIGIHPLDVNANQMVSLDWLLAAIDHPKVVAIGETGFDFYYQKETAREQQQSFELHLEVARLSTKPVIIHTRCAQSITLTLLNKFKLHQAGVLHCFTEDWQMAKAALDLGYYLSLSGIVTFRNADVLREVARKIPYDRLLVETDSPYLAPVPHRGKSNMPEYVYEVAQCVAQLRNVPLMDLMQQTTENFYRLFPLATK